MIGLDIERHLVLETMTDAVRTSKHPEYTSYLTGDSDNWRTNEITDALEATAEAIVPLQTGQLPETTVYLSQPPTDRATALTTTNALRAALGADRQRVDHLYSGERGAPTVFPGVLIDERVSSDGGITAVTLISSPGKNS